MTATIAVLIGVLGLAGCSRSSALDAPAPTVPGEFEADRILARAAVGGEDGTRISERMDAEAEELSSVLEGADVERIEEGIKITITRGILFEEGSDRLGPAAMDLLSTLAAHIAELDVEVVVIGHTDSRGSPEDNVDLSERRARAAVRYLESEGLEARRLSHLGRGELEPLVFPEPRNEESRRRDRRLELVIVAGGRMEAGTTEAGQP